MWINAENAKKKRPAGQPAPQVDFGAVRRMLNTRVQASLEKTDGVHDIYFVFKNESADPNQILVQMLGIEFQNKSDVK